MTRRIFVKSLASGVVAGAGMVLVQRMRRQRLK